MKSLICCIFTLICLVGYARGRHIIAVDGIEDNQYCQCVNYTCGCCSHLEIEKIGLNNTVCVNLTYLPDDIGISFTVTIGNKTVYNETISARSPPPICFGVPYLKELASICIKFHDMDVSLHKLHGCVALEARLGHVEVGNYELGCFNIGNYTHYSLLRLNQTEIPQVVFV